MKLRPDIVRNFLKQEGDIYVVYPESGKVKRSKEQRVIYREALETYPVHLHDRPLACESLANDLNGAFYVVENQDGKKFVFAIRITQANNPVDIDASLWFGAYDHPEIKEWVSKILDVIRTSSSETIAPSI